MHKETLATQTARVYGLVAESGITAPQTGLYLAGGTALALEFGHRQSEDLDFFTKAELLPEHITEQLGKLGRLEVAQEEGRTINAVLDDVKISFISFPYSEVFPRILFEGIDLADERDIAAMKLSAAASRGAKKDLIDLYVLMQKYSLEQLLEFFDIMFAGKQYNHMHILKSLAYFEDADRDPDPIMMVQIEWEDVKTKLMAEAHRLVA